MVEEIRHNGWRQGAVFPASAHEKLRQHAPCEISAEDCCIVVSQSCDIVCPDIDAEPIVEIVLACKLGEGLQGNFTHGKNARCLHFEVEIDRVLTPYEARAKTRFTIPRKILAELIPDTRRVLQPDYLAELVHWIVARYERQAFPDEFNERTSRAIDKKIRPILKRMHRLRSLYVALNKWDELGEGENYELYLVGTISAEDNELPELRTELELGLSRIAKVLNECEGIVVVESEIRSESKMTLSEARNLARWHFDYISFADPEGHVI